VQEGFDRAGTGQVEQDPVLGLFDLGRHFQEGQNDRGGLGVGEPRVLEGVRAQGMVQGIRRTGESQTHSIGEEGGR
jgi:hypothetical protein